MSEARPDAGPRIDPDMLHQEVYLKKIYFLFQEEKTAADNISAAKRPTIETKPREIVVDQGTTIRLPCMVDNLPGSRGKSIYWLRVLQTIEEG